MPYTKPADREPIDPFLESAAEDIETAGDLTYAITKLMHLRALKILRTDHQPAQLKYDKLSAIRASAQDAADEFYRMVMGRYEDKKRRENGPVSILDALTLEDVR